MVRGTVSLAIYLIVSIYCGTARITNNNEDPDTFSEIQVYIDKQIEKLEEKYRYDQKARDERYQSEIASMQSEIMGLKDKIRQLTIRTGEMQQQCSVAIQTLQKGFRPSMVKWQYRQIGKESDIVIAQENTRNENNADESYRVVDKKRQTQSASKVAFYAYLINDTDHLGAGQDIAFDTVVTNVGNAYNLHHGTFIAPASGIYVFSVTLARHGEQGWAEFVRNGQNIGRFDFADPWAVSSQTIVVGLRKGDDVAVRNIRVDRGYRGERLSTFAGFLLYEQDDNDEIVGR